MLEKSDKSFYELTDVRLANLSQLKLFSILNDTTTNEKIMNIFESYNIGDVVYNTSYYELYDVENDDWFEDISYKYYGTINLWWLIAMFNNVINPFEYLEPGLQIKILKPIHIYQVIKEIKNIGIL